MNPAVWVERHGRRLASSPAVAEGERVHATWGEFASTVAAAAAGLRSLGVDFMDGSRGCNDPATVALAAGSVAKTSRGEPGAP